MKKILLWIIRICSALILLLPLYVDGSSIYPYTFSKVIAFQFLVQISLGAYVVLQLLDPSYRVNWKSRLIQAQSLWIGVLVLLSFISVDAMRSWWSTGVWMTGTVTYIHFFAWFLVLSSALKDWKEWRLMIYASMIAAIVVALYGLGQLIGFGEAHYDPEMGRIYSTVGNPIYLSQYLLLHIFIGVFMWLREKELFTKIILCFSVCILTGTIFFTGTRSALLALIISLVLYFFLLLTYASSKRHKIIFLSLLGFLIMSAVGTFLWLQTPVGTVWARTHISRGLQRLIFETFQDPARVELIHIGWQGFLAKPIFGWGPNNFSYVFSTYVKPHDFGILFQKLWYDAAHNQIINILATTGLIGLIAFLLPWFCVWLILWKRFSSASSTRERAEYGILGLFFFAYFLQNLTVFDTPSSLFVLYFIFAFIVFLTRTSNERMNFNACQQRHGIPLVLALTVIVSLMLSAIAMLSVSPYKHARAGKKAIDILKQDYDRGLMYFKYALSGHSFVHDDIRSELARSAFSLAANQSLSEQKRRDFLTFAVEQMEERSKSHLYALEYNILLFDLYRSYAQFSPAALPRAEVLAEKLIDKYPHRRDVLLAYVFIELDLAKIEVAKKYTQKIIDLDPARGDAHWIMAQIHLSAGNLDGVYDEVDLAKKYGYPIFKDGSFYFKAAKLLPKGRNLRFLSYLQGGWQHTPDYVSAAAFYYEKVGNKKAVVQDLVWLKEWDPEYAKRVEDELGQIK